MTAIDQALSHLEDAETAILSYTVATFAITDDTPDEDIPDSFPVILAVLRSVSRAAGCIQAMNGGEG